LLCREDLELELVVLEATTKKVVNFLRKKVHRLLKATSKKVVKFMRKKVHPQTKSWLRLCDMAWYLNSLALRVTLLTVKLGN